MNDCPYADHNLVTERVEERAEERVVVETKLLVRFGDDAVKVVEVVVEKDARVEGSRVEK